jgi:hypothetical protein
MIHECVRCHYKSDKKSSYINHLNKKQKCPTTFSSKSIEELIAELKVYDKKHICTHCDKSFSHESTLSTHIAEKHITDNSSNHHNDNSNHHNNTTINNITNNITIELRPFGEENIDYILTDNDLMTSYLVSAKGDGIINMFEKIHMNSQHPENKNITFKSARYPAKSNVYMRLQGKDNPPEWTVKHNNEIVILFINNIIKHLNNHNNYLFYKIQQPTSDDVDTYNLRQNNIISINSKSKEVFPPIKHKLLDTCKTLKFK